MVNSGLFQLSANNNPTWTITSQNAGLTAAVTGTIIAKGFNLTNASTGSLNIGPGVVLRATTFGTTAGGQLTNNLGGSIVAEGTTSAGTVDPTSTFVYTGNDGTAFPTLPTYLNTGYRTAANPIGGITVGDPTSASISSLRLAANNGTTGVSNGTVYVAGNVIVNASSANTVATNNILNLGGTTLVLQGTANLLGNGTITGNSTPPSVLSWGAGATGGLSPGTAGTVGMLTMTLNSAGFTLNMANAGNSQFDIASAGSYDQIGRGTGQAIAIVYGGKLTLNFLNQVANGTTTFQLFTVNNATETGAFTNDTTLLTDATGSTAGITSITFSEATGQLTVTAAVPEPSTLGLLGGLMLVGYVARTYHRRRKAA